MTHYETLGVPKDATAQQIKEAYMSLAKKWHPDKNPDNREEATARFQAISEAYNTLNDPQQRQRYDYTLQAEEFASTNPYANNPYTSANPYASSDPYNPWNRRENANTYTYTYRTHNSGPQVHWDWFWSPWEQTSPKPRPRRKKRNPVLRAFKWLFWGWVAIKFIPIFLGLIISIAPILFILLLFWGIFQPGWTEHD